MSKILWSMPPKEFHLTENDVHVWCVPLNQSATQTRLLLQLLTADEQSRAARSVFPKDQERFIVARAMLRTILGYYLQVAPATVHFDYGVFGKPFLQDPTQQHLSFNLSHSQEFALYALTYRRPIGVDLEASRPLDEMLQIAQRIFTPNEYAMLCATAPHSQTEMFFQGWTCKEAIVKTSGEGFSFPLHNIEVSFAPGAPCQLVNIAGDPQVPERWTIETLAPAHGYVGTVAVHGAGLKLSCWQWPTLSL